jgi:hypothetical protein
MRTRGLGVAKKRGPVSDEEDMCRCARAGAETAAAKGEEVRRDVWSGDAAGNVLDNFPHVGPAFADWNPSATEQVNPIRQHTSPYVSIRQAPFGRRAGKSQVYLL